MRRRITVVLMAVLMLVMSAAPALAQGTDKPRPTPPATPRGLNPQSEHAKGFEHENRPAHAVTPLTGPGRDPG